MKLFGGNKLAGGSASRAEVYGLFIAAIVLVGGGVGGAFAYSASVQNDSISETATSGGTTADATSVPTASSASESTESVNGGTSEGNSSSGDASSGGSSATSPEQSGAAPVLPPPAGAYVDTRIQEPYIGPADTFSYLSRNHICGWDTQALGGFGWGFDPAEPCNRQFEAYIRDNCGTKDPTTGLWSGIVFGQRCDEMASGTLPILY